MILALLVLVLGQQAVARGDLRKLDPDQVRLVDSSGSKRLTDPKEVVAWTEANSKLPLIGLNSYYAEDGGMLSIAASPYEQGEVAANMAIRILDQRSSPDTLSV